MGFSEGRSGLIHTFLFLLLFFYAQRVNISIQAPVAQGIEQRTSNPLVEGSNPSRRTMNTGVLGLVDNSKTIFDVREMYHSIIFMVESM